MKSLRLVVFILLGLIVAIIPLLGACTEEVPPETIELTFGSTESSESTLSVPDHLWIEKIQEDTNDRVHITPYWGGTLISKEESFAELVRGVADIGYLSIRTGFPLYLGTAAWGYGLPDREAVMSVWGEVWEKFPQFEAEFDAVKLMGRVAVGNYQLLSTKPVRTIEDFQGLQVRATGVYVEIFQALGGEGISMPISESYEALKKGTVDAICVPWDGFKAFSLHEVAEYATVLNLQSSTRPTRGINWDSYNSLPSDIQKHFDDIGEFITAEDNKARDAGDAEGYELAQQAGVEFIELSAEDLTELYEVVDAVMRAEAAELDAQGLPGTEIYEELRGLIDEYNK